MRKCDLPGLSLGEKTLSHLNKLVDQKLESLSIKRLTQLYSPSAYYLRTEQALQYFLWVCRITNKHRLGFFFFCRVVLIFCHSSFFYVLFFEDFRSVKSQTIRNKASQWRMLDRYSIGSKKNLSIVTIFQSINADQAQLTHQNGGQTIYEVAFRFCEIYEVAFRLWEIFFEFHK